MTYRRRTTQSNEDSMHDTLGKLYQKIHLIPVLSVSIILTIIGVILAGSLSVFQTSLGAWILFYNSLILFITVFITYFIAVILWNLIREAEEMFRSKWLWVPIYLFITILSVLLWFKWYLDNALVLDISYVYNMFKSSTDILKINYLNGIAIVVPVIVGLIVVFSDPRITISRGGDDKLHVYTHSKVISFARFIGKGDSSSSTRNKTDSTFTQIQDHDTKYNDKVRMFSGVFLGWALIKFMGGALISGWVINNVQLAIVTQYQYNFFGLIISYFSVWFYRISGGVLISTSFPIDNILFFEAFGVINKIFILLAVIWGVRQGIKILTMWLGSDSDIYRDKDLFANIFSTAMLGLFILFVLMLLNVGTVVYDASTSFWVTSALFACITFLVLGLSPKIIKFFMSKTKTVKAIIPVIVLLAIIFSPVIIGFLTVSPNMEGRQFDYVWQPATYPTIKTMQWNYEIDNIQRVPMSYIITPTSGMLDNVRIFTEEAASLNLRPYIGVNWMGLQAMDIVYINGTEYWISLLTLIRPPSESDVWRTETLLLTHSEKILMADATDTQIVNATQILGLNNTPQMYYGENGLWSSGDVYLHIPGFPEIHLDNATGSMSYEGLPDYIYSGFWKSWKFFWEGHWNFITDYGDISVLTNRDASNRLQSILIPGLEYETDAYPVIDNHGGIYLCFWVWIDHASPSAYHGDSNSILRRFAVVTVNLYNGELKGYLADTDRTDYILDFYRGFYPQWNNAMPDWLISQLRYPEEFLEKQIDAYNIYFQDNFQQQQAKQFYELTKDTSGNTIEDVRYIVTPINGKLQWCAVRLVEYYGRRNLSGMYIAPGGNETGKIYFVDFSVSPYPVISPETARYKVQQDPRITLQPNFPTWQAGNILMYSIYGKLYYIIPYYKGETSILSPQMVAIVEANTESPKVGFHIISDSTDANEIGQSPFYALQDLNGTTPPLVIQNYCNGTISSITNYVQDGNTRYILGVNSTTTILVKVELLDWHQVNLVANATIGQHIESTIDDKDVVTSIINIT